MKIKEDYTGRDYLDVLIAHARSKEKEVIDDCCELMDIMTLGAGEVVDGPHVTCTADGFFNDARYSTIHNVSRLHKMADNVYVRIELISVYNN